MSATQTAHSLTVAGETVYLDSFEDARISDVDGFVNDWNALAKLAKSTASTFGKVRGATSQVARLMVDLRFRVLVVAPTGTIQPDFAGESHAYRTLVGALLDDVTGEVLSREDREAFGAAIRKATSRGILSGKVLEHVLQGMPDRPQDEEVLRDWQDKALAECRRIYVGSIPKAGFPEAAIRESLGMPKLPRVHAGNGTRSDSPKEKAVEVLNAFATAGDVIASISPLPAAVGVLRAAVAMLRNLEACGGDIADRPKVQKAIKAARDVLALAAVLADGKATDATRGDIAAALAAADALTVA
jgi:hypothetical protein